jgi:inosine-uridine nucleoside N-ribohydrolase
MGSSNAPRKNVWVDCDVGQDDVFALVLAMGSPEVNLMGISTCYGNSNLENTTSNTLRILTAAGNTSVPVFKGLAGPFLSSREPMASNKIHGLTGLAGTKLLPAATRKIEPIHAVAGMAQAFSVMEDESVYLCITGPMSNVAVLFCLYPQITKKIKQLVIMGGAFGLASPLPASEMNIVSDPEAAETIFQNPSLCGKIVLIPLETTHTARATELVRNSILGDGKSTFKRMLYELVSQFASSYFGFLDGPPVHDPLTVCYVLHPEEFVTELVHVTVVLGGKADGKTICDMNNSRYYTNETKNVHVSRKVNVPFFWEKMVAAIDKVATQSTLN